MRRIRAPVPAAQGWCGVGLLLEAIVFGGDPAIPPADRLTNELYPNTRQAIRELLLVAWEEVDPVEDETNRGRLAERSSSDGVG